MFWKKKEIADLKVKMRNLLLENGTLRENILKLEDRNAVLNKKLNEANKTIDYKDEQIFKASENIVALLDKNKKMRGANGGLTAQNNALKKKVSELEEKLKESMTDKYLVRKVKSEKPKNQQVRMKNRKYNSQVERILIEKNTKEKESV